LGPFVLRFKDLPTANGPWLGGLRRIRHDPQARLGHLQDAERWIRGRVLEMEHPDLAHDPVAAPRPLNLDDAVERLV